MGVGLHGLLADFVGGAMSDDVERVAAAMWDVSDKGYEWQDADDHLAEIYRSRARAAIAAMPPREVAGWQPIETAPKGGRVVFVWHVTNINPYAGFDTNIKKARYLPELEEWQVEGVGGNVAPVLTHWMPLPPAPGGCAMTLLPAFIRRLLPRKPAPPKCTDENIAALMGRERKPDDIARRGEGDEL